MTASTNENIHLKQNEMLSFKTLIAVFILFLYTISAPIFEKLKIQFIHESGMSMIIGVTVTIIAMIINPDVIFFYKLIKDQSSKYFVL
jgi:hypothetical protein